MHPFETVTVKNLANDLPTLKVCFPSESLVPCSTNRWSVQQVLKKFHGVPTCCSFVCFLAGLASTQDVLQSDICCVQLRQILYNKYCFLLCYSGKTNNDERYKIINKPKQTNLRQSTQGFYVHQIHTNKNQSKGII